jgi:hypothetical protein
MQRHSRRPSAENSAAPVPAPPPRTFERCVSVERGAASLGAPSPCCSAPGLPSEGRTPASAGGLCSDARPALLAPSEVKSARSRGGRPRPSLVPSPAAVPSVAVPRPATGDHPGDAPPIAAMPYPGGADTAEPAGCRLRAAAAAARAASSSAVRPLGGAAAAAAGLRRAMDTTPRSASAVPAAAAAGSPCRACCCGWLWWCGGAAPLSGVPAAAGAGGRGWLRSSADGEPGEAAASCAKKSFWALMSAERSCVQRAGKGRPGRGIWARRGGEDHACKGAPLPCRPEAYVCASRFLAAGRRPRSPALGEQLRSNVLSKGIHCCQSVTCCSRPSRNASTPISCSSRFSVRVLPPLRPLPSLPVPAQQAPPPPLSPAWRPPLPPARRRSERRRCRSSSLGARRPALPNATQSSWSRSQLRS